jgi:uncharacterized protein
MFINTDKISEKGFSISDSIDPDESLLVEDGGYFLENLNFDIFLIRDNNHIKAKGRIRTAVSLQCVRCLEEFELKINSRFDVILFPAYMVEPANVSLGPDDMEYIFYEDNQINLIKILVEQVNLFIPYNPVCDDDCKGICPNCGVNLNYEDCICDDSTSAWSLLFDKIKR